MKFIWSWLVVALAGVMSAPLAAAELVAGRDYTLVNPAQPTGSADKVVVTEFFNYQCPHCFALSGSLREWKARLPSDVVCRREAVSIGHPTWEASARAFYALESMGKVDALDGAFFSAVHKTRVPLTTEATVTQWLATQGIAPQTFKSAYNSFGVQAKYQRGKQLAISHRLPSVPSLVIDGKYLVAIASNIDFRKQLDTVDALIARARVERGLKQ